MKNNIKIVALIYVVVALFAYALSLRAENLENNDSICNQNQSIVINVG